MKKTLPIKDLTVMALLVALISASAYIMIPLPFTPVLLTLQTMMVNLVAFLLPPGQAVCTILVYALLGLVGLPVFSGGMGGPAKLFGPTGGYILSWIPTVAVLSLLKGKESQVLRRSLAAVFVGMPVSSLIVTLYMKLLTGTAWEAAFTAAVLPFIPLDVLKCIGAAIIARPLEAALKADGRRRPAAVTPPDSKA